MPLREARRIVCAVWSERRCARGILVFPVPPVRRIVMKDQKYVQSRMTGQYRSVTVGRYTQLSRSCLDKYFHNRPRLQWSGTLNKDTGMLIEIAWSGLGKHVGKCALLKKRSCVTFLMGLSVIMLLLLNLLLNMSSVDYYVSFLWISD